MTGISGMPCRLSWPCDVVLITIRRLPSLVCGAFRQSMQKLVNEIGNLFPDHRSLLIRQFMSLGVGRHHSINSLHRTRSNVGTGHPLLAF